MSKTKNGYPEGWTYDAPDPSVGIFGGGWIHEDCEHEVQTVNEVAIGSVRKDNGEVETDYRITCSCGAEAIVTDHDYDPPEEAFMSDVERTEKDKAREYGIGIGNSAGSWVIDGNTTKNTAVHIIKGYEQGDPAVMGMEPSVLSGEYSGDLTPEAVLREAGVPPLEERKAGWDYTDVIDAFEEGFTQAYWDTVITAARSVVDGAICAKCGKTIKRAWEHTAEARDFWEDMSGFQSCDSDQHGTHQPAEQEATA